MTLVEVEVKWSIVVMDLFGPTFSPHYKWKDRFYIVSERFWKFRVVISLKWTSDQKVAYVLVAFEWN